MDFDHAKLLHERGQFDEAIQIYDQLLNKNFHRADVLFYYGTAALQKGQHGLAANLLKSSAEIDPKQRAVYQNLGSCFRAENKTKEAEDIYRIGIEIEETAELWSNLASLYVNNGTPEKALEMYRRALQLDPTNKSVMFNMGFPYLEMGNFKDGWRCYDLGLKSGDRKTRNYGVPEWHGEKNKTVIVWGEQGIGDEIMFSSCIPDLKRISKRVIFDCHPRLVKTFERSFGIECHGTRKTQYLDWLKDAKADYSVCVSTLAKHFRKSVKDFPGTPYIKSESTRHAGEKLRVGVSWAGGSKQTRQDLRSLKLDDLLPILKEDCEFYSLQYTPEAARQVCAFEEKHGIHIRHYPDLVECKDYDKTVNFVGTLDLVISVCTAVIHAAGSMGVPCWILTPSKPAWRYGVHGPMPWYKSVRLFRQKDEWSPVINQVAEELHAHIRAVPRSQQEVA